MQKYYRWFLIILLLKSWAAAAQQYDTRARLDIRGGIEEISVSPDNSVWLATKTGYLYYSKTIDGNWHSIAIKGVSENDYDMDNPVLDRVSFFNKDTAIITGYISANRRKDEKMNGYYRTCDGGKTWKLMHFDGNTWIYTACTDKQGHAWMGGADKKVYYTADFGKTWANLKMPYKACDRTYFISMKNASTGIACSEKNEILTTHDNWKTTAQIPTPLDQGKYALAQNGSNDDPVSNAGFWKNYIIIKQANHIFYSDTLHIDWQPFKALGRDAMAFATVPDSEYVYALVPNGSVVKCFEPGTCITVSDIPQYQYPSDFKAVNHDLYILSGDNKLTKIADGNTISTYTYTTDVKIPEPALVKKGTRMAWGAIDNELYMKTKEHTGWYREAKLGFSVSDISVMNDSTAVLWDGEKNNYLYSLKTHEAEIYKLPKPIDGFLKFPVTSFSVYSTSAGCFHHVVDQVNYAVKNDSLLSVSDYSIARGRDVKKYVFTHTINQRELTDILTALNKDPENAVSINDFKFTEADIQKYYQDVNNRLEHPDINISTEEKEKLRAFYDSVPGRLVGLSATANAVLDSKESIWSTTSHDFSLEIVNGNHDTLFISHTYSIASHAWHLPWQVRYKGNHFSSKSIRLSHFIASCIPDTFMSKEACFNNSMIIMEIADMLLEWKEL